tara:strand:+ start:158 stop:682 length:525 start_codon:yes stop_codon:yes gene_type:complete
MLKNNISKYGSIAKIFHWVTFIFLMIQVPFGFYISNLEFSLARVNLESYHTLSGVIIFYIVLARLIWKFFNPIPKMWSKNKLQVFIARTNHFFLYLFLLIIIFSGVLKKFFIEEPINLIFFDIQSSKTIFELSNTFYELHWLSSIILVSLVLLHILGASYNHIILKQKILKKIT